MRMVTGSKLAPWTQWKSSIAIHFMSANDNKLYPWRQTMATVDLGIERREIGLGSSPRMVEVRLDNGAAQFNFLPGRRPWPFPLGLLAANCNANSAPKNHPLDRPRPEATEVSLSCGFRAS